MHNNSTGNNSTTGIGFMGLLGILFIGLKLTGYIGWSWWWVTAPIWGPLALFIAILLFVWAISFVLGRD